MTLILIPRSLARPILAKVLLISLDLSLQLELTEMITNQDQDQDQDQKLTSYLDSARSCSEPSTDLKLGQ